MALREAAADSKVPVASTFLAVDGLVDRLSLPEDDVSAARGSVPSFRTPERAVAALTHAVHYARWRARPVGQLMHPAGVDGRAARELVDTWPPISGAPRGLADAELIQLLRCYGIAVADFRLVDSRGSAIETAGIIGYPVVLKAFDASQRERLQGSGVRASLETAEQVGAAYDVLSGLTGPRAYLQRMAAPDCSGVETVFGIAADPSFGSLVSFGIAGVTTDLLDDRGHRAVPLTDQDAVDLIAAPRAAVLLDGYRGGTVVDREPLADLALRLSVLSEDVPELIDLQLRALAGARGITVIGATGSIGIPPARLDTRRSMR